MKYKILVFTGIFLVFVSCRSVLVKPSVEDVFAPYASIPVENQEVWNVAFNRMRKDLINTVTNSLPDYEEQIGLVAELEGSSHQKNTAMILAYPVIRAWSIFEKDVFALPSQDLEMLNTGGVQSPYQTVPKIKFFVRRLRDNRYEVIARLWLKKYVSYNWVYIIQKGLSGWEVASKKLLNR